ncbi:hypothetical protein GMDG_01844 [Pseudogymnoascus destructans 20631-21]|uniref:Protamine P1 n=2 Tax=Pseudogymnoascus destructans TaxID=655981 RepID=L8G1D5_PSED2|nr:hypothetical protein GMDG_01844 [Pseudogymnoascus destructans 20631-21]
MDSNNNSRQPSNSSRLGSNQDFSGVSIPQDKGPTAHEMAALERARLQVANLGDGMALCFDDEVICEGSDAEDGPLAKAERQKRREAIELRYIAGHAPLIMSAQLRGPFDKNSGWVNPWRSKRPTQKQPTNRTTVTEPLNLAHKTTSVVGLGKRRRNDSNSSSSVGTRTKALAECSSTSMDIVINRQPGRPQLYSGFKRFAANQLERPTDFASLDERENILQKRGAGIKRRADTNWLKGADVGKRSRNNWPDLTSPTPKERTRDIISNDNAIIDASSMSMSDVNIAKFNRQLSAETASLSEFEDIPISTADSIHSKRTAIQRRGDGNVQPTPNVTAKKSEDTQREISMGPDSASRVYVESASSARSVDGDGSDSAMEIGRTAPDYSLDRSSFVEPESSLGHKSVQSCASVLSFEPSPVHTISRSQLSQEILHGLSQASQLARSAEKLTPLKPRDSALNIVERHPSDLAKRNGLSLSSRKTPSQLAPASLNHTSQARSQSHPLPKSPVEVKMLKPKINDPSRSFDSPLPPGSLKYRRVKRKAPTPIECSQGGDTSNVIGKQKTPEAAPLQPIEVRDDAHKKDVVSPASQALNYVDLAKDQFSTSDSGQQPPGSVPIIEITDNDADENSETKPLGRDIDDQAPTHTSVPPISPAIKDGANRLEAGDESCPKPIIDGRGSESSFDAPAMRGQESGESEGLLAIQPAPGTQPPPPIETAAETLSGDVEHRKEPTFEDVTLSQDPGSPLASPELTDNESTLVQILQHGSQGPNSKSSPLPPLPDIVDDDQLSEASFMSATDESSSKSLPAPAGVEDDQVSEASFTFAPEEVDSLPAPQSPWAAEEDVPAPQSLLIEPTVGTGNFSMSQSKDAAVLLTRTESHYSAAGSSVHNVELSVRNPESADYNSEPPQSNEVVDSGPASLRLIPTGSAPPSPDHLSGKSHTPQSASVGNQDLLPLSNPWANNTQSPIIHPSPIKRKKRVSFNPQPLDSDNEDKQPNQPNNNAPESRDLSCPPPPPEAESLTEGDNSFHRKLKWTSGILSRRASNDQLSVPREDTVPGSPGVGAMAEAFLAADARVQSTDSNSGEVRDKNEFAGSESFDLVEDGEQQDKVVAASAVRAIPLMTESQLVNPWGDEDEAPLFCMADCRPEEDDGLVEDVLSDMDAMLGDWNVDAELDRAKREGRGKTGRDETARERLVEAGY